MLEDNEPDLLAAITIKFFISLQRTLYHIPVFTEGKDLISSLVNYKSSAYSECELVRFKEETGD